ncbi:septum formation initiator family protein [Patescibacteria group bacterium]|nr:septum formation initiator family protein [Patescibacteria group bacterium]MBU1563753.1 septum formation initiator family protein [Patescibacteria group bacterium]MBU2068250.1 septum formation initiator family protein [Patescibacteria group bacterium]
MVQSDKNFFKKILSSKVFLFVVTLALIAVAVNVGRESYRKYQLTQEINKLKIEIEKIEGKNEQLANLMEYLKKEPYLEKEARLKLNLKKPGEKVIILSDEEQKEQETVINDISELKESGNHWKWWEYFFSP